MRTSVLRIAAVLALAVTMVLGLGGHNASAASTGIVNLHFRWCPADAVDVYADCHDNPIVGLDNELDDGEDVFYDNCTTGNSGNCSYEVIPGTYSWWYDELDGGIPDWDTDFLGSYCSEEAAPGTYLEDEEGYFDVAADDVVTCDIYFYSASLPPVHGGDGGSHDGGAHALPTAGSGPVDGGNGMLPLALVAAAALAGLGVATRKVSIR